MIKFGQPGQNGGYARACYRTLDHAVRLVSHSGLERHSRNEAADTLGSPRTSPTGRTTSAAAARQTQDLDVAIEVEDRTVG